MSHLIVRHKRRFGVVPDHVLEEKSLSLSARAVAAWLTGRQNGFSIRVEVMKSYFLGITESRWKTIRCELEKIGWWRSSRKKSANGKFEWVHEFSDTGFLSFDQLDAETAIPSKSKDGKSNDDSTIDVEDMYANSRDNQENYYHQDFDQQETTTTFHEAGGDEFEQIIESAIWSKKKSGGAIDNVEAWKFAIRKRLQVSGPSKDDIEVLKSWRNYLFKIEENTKVINSVINSSQNRSAEPINVKPEEELNKFIEILKRSKSRGELL